MPQHPLPRPTNRLSAVDADRIVGWVMAAFLPVVLAYAWFTR